jgi:hypothetical protein
MERPGLDGPEKGEGRGAEHAFSLPWADRSLYQGARGGVPIRAGRPGRRRLCHERTQTASVLRLCRRGRQYFDHPEWKCLCAGGDPGLETAAPGRTHCPAAGKRAVFASRTRRPGLRSGHRPSGTAGGTGRGRLCLPGAYARGHGRLRHPGRGAGAAAFRLRRGGISRGSVLRGRGQGGRGPATGLYRHRSRPHRQGGRAVAAQVSEKSARDPFVGLRVDFVLPGGAQFGPWAVRGAASHLTSVQRPLCGLPVASGPEFGLSRHPEPHRIPAESGRDRGDHGRTRHAGTAAGLFLRPGLRG